MRPGNPVEKFVCFGFIARAPFMLMKIPLVSPSLVFCFTIFGCLMNWFRNISMEHHWKSLRQVIWIYMVYLYIYAHMYAVYIQSVLTYIFHLWGLSNVKVSLRRAEIASTANNGIMIIVDLFLFSVVIFFPSFYSIQSDKKKMLKTNWCFLFCVCLLSFRCFRGQLPRCCNNPFQPSPVHAGGVLSRLLSTCEFHRGNGRVEMCCGGVVASLDLMVVTNWVLTKGRRKGHKAFKIFTFWSVRQILSLKFRIELESRHSFFQRLQQSDGVATAWAKSWSIFFWSQSMTAKLHRKVIGVTSPRNKVL